jgi:hypothetical protein
VRIRVLSNLSSDWLTFNASGELSPLDNPRDIILFLVSSIFLYKAFLHNLSHLLFGTIAPFYQKGGS